MKAYPERRGSHPQARQPYWNARTACFRDQTLRSGDFEATLPSLCPITVITIHMLEKAIIYRSKIYPITTSCLINSINKIAVKLYLCKPLIKSSSIISWLTITISASTTKFKDSIYETEKIKIKNFNTFLLGLKLTWPGRKLPHSPSSISPHTPRHQLHNRPTKHANHIQSQYLKKKNIKIQFQYLPNQRRKQKRKKKNQPYQINNFECDLIVASFRFFGQSLHVQANTNVKQST